MILGCLLLILFSKDVSLERGQLSIPLCFWTWWMCFFDSPISMDSKASCLPALQGESKILETFIVYEDMGSCKPDLQHHNLIVSFTCDLSYTLSGLLFSIYLFGMPKLSNIQNGFATEGSRWCMHIFVYLKYSAIIQKKSYKKKKLYNLVTLLTCKFFFSICYPTYLTIIAEHLFFLLFFTGIADPIQELSSGYAVSCKFFLKTKCLCNTVVNIFAALNFT